MKLPYAEIRLQLRALLGETEILEKDWVFLVNAGSVERVNSGEKPTHWLLDRFRELKRYARDRTNESVPVISRSREGRLLRTRIDVLSTLCARMAEKDETVAAFRREILGNKLLAGQEVREWIRETAKTEGTPTRFLSITIPAPKGTAGRRLPTALSVKIPAGTPFDTHYPTLEYAVPGEDFMQREFVVQGGVLERLRSLSRRLADEYGWDHAQATFFVLTGTVPLTRALNVTRTWSNRALKNRIVIDADPSVPPLRVAQVYRSARTELSKDINQGRRLRTLSERHLRLAEFIDGRPAEESWKDRMKLWNRTHRKWKYSAEAYLKRDFRAACAHFGIRPDNEPGLGIQQRGSIMRVARGGRATSIRN